MRLAILTALAVLSTGPGVAGPAYTPPALAPAEWVDPPSSLVTAVEAFRDAVLARDVEAVAPFIAPQVEIINGALDMHIPRSEEAIGPWPDATAALVDLGQNTGGDWYQPDGVSLEDALVETAFENWQYMLEDPIPFGRDPLAGDAICTYAMQAFDPAEVGRVAEALAINSSAFIMVDEPTAIVDSVDGTRTVATFEPGRLYALDYDTDAPSRWMAVHLPEGGVGFIQFGDEGMGKPYAWGICFEQDRAGQWQVVAQVSTSL